MPLRIPRPADGQGPLARLHPEAREGFRAADGAYWSSVSEYLLGQAVHDPALREQVRMSRDLATARAHAGVGEGAPDPAVLGDALRRLFEARLSTRALLLGTGDEALEVEAGPPGYGAALEAARAHVRQRARDPEAIQCQHQEETDLVLVCEHLLAGDVGQGVPTTHRVFAGRGREYRLACAACGRGSEHLRRICRDCHDAYLSIRLIDVGEPEFPVRSTDLTFRHSEVTLPGLPAPAVIALAGVARAADAWLLLDRDGVLFRADLTAGRTSRVADGLGAEVDLGKPVVLVVADDGSLAAVAERDGRRAAIVDSATGGVVLRLERDDYHPEHCPHPIAFVRDGERLLLVHATRWNRLDVSDPRTGELVTARESPVYDRAHGPGAHYLDYFHASILPSPDGAYLIDDGWLWHPWGIVVCFSVRDWLHGNVWESEDGPSRFTLTDRSYFWAGPKCWLDERTACVWGLGTDDDNLLPGVHVVDVITRERRELCGQGAGLAAVPPWLVSFDRRRGTAVWEPTTGARLHHQPDFCPEVQHPGSRAFLSRHGDAFIVSRLAGDGD
jgi:hypothetical protein